jgi:hypothetical protein
MMGLPYAQQAGQAAGVAATAGYGRRRRRRAGTGLYAAGGKMRRGGELMVSRRPMVW